MSIIVKKYTLPFFLIYYWLTLYFIELKTIVTGYAYYILTVPPVLFIFILFPISILPLCFKNFIIKKSQCAILIFSLILPMIVIAKESFINAVAVSIMGLLLYFSLDKKLAINLNFINYIFLMSIIGSVISYHNGSNPFGYLPGQERGETFQNLYRVSLFPSITDSAIFSLIVFFLNIFHKLKFRIIIITLSIYFVIFSFSRTALLALFLTILAVYIKKIGLNRFVQFFIPIIVLFLIVALPNLIAEILINFGSTGFSLLRINEVGDVDSSHVNGRLFLWLENMSAFKDNVLLGAGRDGLLSYKFYQGLDYSATGSESFLTRIFGQYGLVSFLFCFFLWRLNHDLNKYKRSYMGLSIVIIFTTALLLNSPWATPYSFLFFLFIAVFSYINNENHKFQYLNVAK